VTAERLYAVWETAAAAGQQRAHTCSLRTCQCSAARQLPCSSAKLSGHRPVSLLAGLQRGGRNFLVVWTMQSCNGREALEALVLAGKGLNAFSVLFLQASKIVQTQYINFRGLFCYVMNLYNFWRLQNNWQRYHPILPSPLYCITNLLT
jgi:hypothetical protein